MFADKYNAKHDKAVACLAKDREALLAYFDFPVEHWDHLRTSNPIRERVRDGASPNREDERSPVGEDCEADGVQTRQCRREKVATIEG